MQHRHDHNDGDYGAARRPAEDLKRCMRHRHRTQMHQTGAPAGHDKHAGHSIGMFRLSFGYLTCWRSLLLCGTFCSGRSA